MIGPPPFSSTEFDHRWRKWLSDLWEEVSDCCETTATEIAEPYSFRITGTNATLSRTRVFSVDSGNFDWSGTEVSLVVNIPLDAESGSFTWNGTDTTLEIVEETLTCHPLSGSDNFGQWAYYIFGDKTSTFGCGGCVGNKVRFKDSNGDIIDTGGDILVNAPIIYVVNTPPFPTTSTIIATDYTGSAITGAVTVCIVE